MALSTQMSRLIARLEAYPGIGSVWPEIPDDKPDGAQLPAFGIHLLPFEFQASNVSVFTYPMQIVYLHEEWPDDWLYGTLPDAVLDMPQSLFNWLAADAVLMHGSYGVQFGEPAGEHGVVPLWDQSYAGCSLFIALKEKENTAWA